MGVVYVYVYAFLSPIFFSKSYSELLQLHQRMALVSSCLTIIRARALSFCGLVRVTRWANKCDHQLHSCIALSALSSDTTHDLKIFGVHYLL